MPLPILKRNTPQQALTLAYGQLMALVVFWGANFIVIGSVLDQIDPLTVSLLRFCGALVVFAVFCKWKGISLMPHRSEWLALCGIGWLQIGIGSILTAVSMQYIPPGRASVLCYTMQIWSLLFGFVLIGERLTRLAMLGIALSSVGLAVFLSPWLVDWSDKNTLIGYTMVSLVGVTWALGSTLYRRREWVSSAYTLTLWQVAFSCILACLVLIIVQPSQPVIISPKLIAALVFNWFIPSMLCYVWWNEVIKVMPAATAGQFVSITPILVLLGSAFFTGEQLSPAVLLSAALVAAGIALSARAMFRKP